jgi:hypothetical protein
MTATRRPALGISSATHHCWVRRLAGTTRTRQRFIPRHLHGVLFGLAARMAASVLCRSWWQDG